MSNNIALATQYVALLDEVYKNASLTSVLDGNTDLVAQGANANELIIPKMTMDGLADYSRNGGYVGGDVTMSNETVTCNFDRGRMFSVDSMDDIETAGLAFGRLSSEFIRTKVVPELDAFRFAKYAGTIGISTASADLTTGEEVIAAISAAADGMTNAGVPEENRILFITPTHYGLVRDLDTTKSREILASFSQIVKVPQSRFYSAIKQNDGKTSGETAGGYVKAEGAVNINFMIVEKSATIQFEKHIAPKIVTPDQNQDADAYKFGYRNVGIAEVYDNKVTGIYCHMATA